MRKPARGPATSCPITFGHSLPPTWGDRGQTILLPTIFFILPVWGRRERSREGREQNPEPLLQEPRSRRLPTHHYHQPVGEKRAGLGVTSQPATAGVGARLGVGWGQAWAGPGLGGGGQAGVGVARAGVGGAKPTCLSVLV